jgi:hypothetical protein
MSARRPRVDLRRLGPFILVCLAHAALLVAPAAQRADVLKLGFVTGPGS